jgi:hypothetical protein
LHNDKPLSLSRELQLVAFSAQLFSLLTITGSMRASLIVRGASEARLVVLAAASQNTTATFYRPLVHLYLGRSLPCSDLFPRRSTRSEPMPALSSAALDTSWPKGETSWAFEPLGLARTRHRAAQRANENKDQQIDASDLTICLQQELQRVGCNPEAVDGNWNAASQRALKLFNRYADLKLVTKLASSDALDAVGRKTSRICSLVRKAGFLAASLRQVCGVPAGVRC